MYEVPHVIYQGRKWDAPMTDGAIAGTVTGQCDLCQEEILPEDNALQLPLMKSHLECQLRVGLGSVEHLEGRCTCCGGSDVSQERSFREEARASLKWILLHGQGRFSDTHRKEAHD